MARQRRPAIEVLVVGAGPTGLVAALILAAYGVHVRLVDTSPPTESRALVVHARTLELLDKLDLAAAFLRDGRPATGLRIFSGGRPLPGVQTVDRGRSGERRTPYPIALVLQQDHIERLLIDAVERTRVSIERDVEIERMTEADGRVVVTGRRAGRATRMTTDWVIGADGAHSAVRRAMGVDFVDGADVAVDGLAVDWNVDGQDPEWISEYRPHHHIAASFRIGRMFAVGDAAQLRSPPGGPDVNWGVQDAFNLGWKLAAVVRGRASEALLDSYAAEREPVAKARLRRTVVVSSAIAWAWRLVRIPVGRVPGIVRLPAVPRRVFAALSEIDIHYRGSSAVDGTRSRVAGPGMRAPHAVLDHGPRRGASILELLRGVEHHLLLFAESDSDDGAALRAVSAAVPVRVVVHRIRPDEQDARRAYGVRRSAALLVRPDGHIGWRGRLDDAGALQAHFGRWYLVTRAD